MDDTTQQETSELTHGQAIGQFLRFAVVGFVNTVVNFLVLNLLSYLTHIQSGPSVVFLSLIAFAVAMVNSYFLNDYWVFKDMSHGEGGRKFTLFLTVSVVGAGINSAVVYVVTTFVHPMFGFSSAVWLNIANLIATCVALLWNFFGYKIFVFKK